MTNIHCTSGSLIPRPTITASVVEGLVKLLRRMMSGECLVSWHFWRTAVHMHAWCVNHAYKRTSDVILCRNLPLYLRSSCMETGLLMVQENLKKGDSITLSHT